MSSQPMQSDQASPPAASPEFLDRSDPEAEIARAVRAYSNWGRWGADDVLGTVNFITDGLRLAAAWCGAEPASRCPSASTWTGRSAAGGGGPTRCTPC